MFVPAVLAASRLTGCAAPSRVETTAAALRSFADRLSRATGEYTAGYVTGDNAQVVYAQQLPRRTYRGPGAMYLLSPEAAYLCRIRVAETGGGGGASAPPTEPAWVEPSASAAPARAAATPSAPAPAASPSTTRRPAAKAPPRARQSRTPGAQPPQAATTPPVRCDRTPGADSMPLHHARAVSATVAERFLVPELVAAHLTRLAGRMTASRTDIGRLDTSRRSIAGQPVECISIVGQFTACATGSGVLARYDSEEGSLELARFEPKVDPAMLAVPANAAMTDVMTLG